MYTHMWMNEITFFPQFVQIVSPYWVAFFSLHKKGKWGPGMAEPKLLWNIIKQTNTPQSLNRTKHEQMSRKIQKMGMLNENNKTH